MARQDLNTSPMDYDDLEPVLVPVRLGKLGFFVLREAPEAVAARYNNAKIRAVRLNEEGKMTGVDGGGDVPAVLVAGCLCKANEDFKPLTTRAGDLIPVGEPFVNGLPGWLVTELFERAKHISRLEGSQKKDASDTPVTLPSQQPSESTSMNCSPGPAP